MSVLTQTYPTSWIQPTLEQEQLASGEKRPKDRLVVPGQPQGQVDIEVGRPGLGVASRQISQWAAALIHRQDGTLEQYQPCQHRRSGEPSLGGSEGNCQYASSEEEPNRCVQELYPYQY